MNLLLRNNVNEFDSKEDHEYFFRKDHILRGEITAHLFREVLNKKIPKHSQKLLSIACSTGIIEKKLKTELGIEVHGIDAAKKSLKKAKSRGVITKYADVSKTLPYGENYFDYVYAGEIIEHIFDTRKFIKELNRVAKPGGYLVITTPNLARLDDRIKFLLGTAPRQVAPLHEYLYLHIRPFTYDLLKKSLEAYGFSETTLRTNVIRLDLFSRNITLYSKFLSNHFPGLGATLIVRSQKTGTT